MAPIDITLLPTEKPTKIFLHHPGTFLPYKYRFLPAYYYIPKSMLQNSGQVLSSIPRNPRKLIRDKQALAIIKSSLFELLIVDAYAGNSSRRHSSKENPNTTSRNDEFLEEVHLE